MHLSVSVQNRLFSVITTWPFLACLLLLLLNDWWLKTAYPGVLSGKLSDFSGIAVVAMLLLATWPKRPWMIFVAVSVAFWWWKSPASEPLIRGFNTLGVWRVGRTVDYTDLMALVVLPWCRAAVAHMTVLSVPWPRLRRLLLAPVALATLFGVMGTSSLPTRHDYVVRKIASTDTWSREAVADTIQAVAEQHGMKCYDCANPTDKAGFSSEGLSMSYVFSNPASVSFQITAHSTSLFFGTSGDELAERLRATLKAELAARFKGLEYVEPLASARLRVR